MSLRSTIALLLFAAVTVQAAPSDITGDWLLTSASYDGQAEEPLIIMTFAEDGRILSGDYPFASWSLDDDGRVVVSDCEDDDPLAGTLEIETLDDRDLVLRKGDAAFIFERFDTARVSEFNERSGLAGCWELESGPHESTLLLLTLPDDLTLVHSSGGMTDTEHGQWLVSPDGDELLVLYVRELISGRNGLRVSGDDRIGLETRDGDLEGRRRPPTGIERLTFQLEDLPEDPPEGLPAAWLTLETLVEGLTDVRRLDYRWGRLLPDFGVFEYTSALESEITVDPDRPSVLFTQYSVSADGRDQYAQNVKEALSESDNPFFPRDLPWPYRIVGHEDIDVPAGMFTCTVVEGFDDETRIKMWMIDDLPGAYARVIEQATDVFGDLRLEIFELEHIVR